MRLEHITEFIVLAETLNYTAAAERLYLAQPTLTKHIQALENDLGTQLLDRTTHAVVLTEEGRLALEAFRAIVEQYETLQHEISARRAGIAGELCVGAPYYGLHEQLGPILTEVESRYPNLRLAVASLQPHQIVRGIRGGSLDVGLLMRTPALSEEQYLFQHLCFEECYAIRARGDSAEEPAPTAVADLGEETLVIMSVDREYMDVIMGMLQQHGVTPPVIVDALQIDLVTTKLRSSGGYFLGPGVLRRMAPDDLSFGRVVASPPLQLDMGFYAPAPVRSPALEVFLAVCREFAVEPGGPE